MLTELLWHRCGNGGVVLAPLAAHAAPVIHRNAARTLRRLVVGVGVHGQKTEPFHDPTLVSPRMLPAPSDWPM